MKNFPKFYLIVDDVSWLPRLLPLGVRLVQLRLKDKPKAVIMQQIIEAKKQCEAVDCQLVINDYWELALEASCDYLHLGQEDLVHADVDKIKAAGMKLGISTHSSEELQIALAIKPDYIALGPVYETTLKKMRWQPQGLDRVREWKHAIGDIPLVGIGGLTIERAQGVYDAGADCISVVSDVLKNKNPEMRLKQWLDRAK
ncbi:thiamine phosphate synthase [Psychrobacter sp. DM4]|uniref:thiamine phosphate synthase n=1 Tax=Psychrobacter sp. DM4 TaxID=3440637 RepID=UPI003F4FEADF